MVRIRRGVRAVTLLLGSLALAGVATTSQAPSPTDQAREILFSPGQVNAAIDGDSAWLANDSLVVTWQAGRKGFRLSSISDRLGGRTVPRLGEILALRLADGTVLQASAMEVTSRMVAEAIEPLRGAGGSGGRLRARQLRAVLSPDVVAIRTGPFAQPGWSKRLTIDWRAELEEGADRVRQQFTIGALATDLPIVEIQLVDASAPDIRVVDTPDGSAAVAGGSYAGIDQPGSRCEVEVGRARCWVARHAPLRAGQTLTVSSVVGLGRAAEIQEDFLTRGAHPRTPESAPAPAEPFRLLAGPVLQAPDGTSMTVTWVTNRPSAAWVEYGDDASMPERAVSVRDGLVEADTRAHKVTLTGLVPGTTYRYRVVAREVLAFGPYKVSFGDQLATTPSRFTTLSPARQVYSFIVLNDGHEEVSVMKAHLQRADAAPYDLVFFNGDMLSHLESESQVIERMLAPAAELFAQRTPLLYVRGNHETRGRFARRLGDYVVLPGGRYYGAFSHGPVRFVVLDTGEDKVDGHWAYSGLTDFDRYRAEQAAWLAGELKSRPFGEARFRVLVHHIPFYPASAERAEGHGVLDCRARFGPLLEQAGIDLGLAAHNHRVAVHPADGRRVPFPLIVGGGPKSSSSTCIRVDVSPDRLDVTLTTDTGADAGRITVRAR